MKPPPAAAWQDTLAGASAPHDVLAQLVQRAAEGLFAFDTGGRLMLWNPAMERLTGMGAADVLGHEVWLALATEQAAVRGAVAAVLGGQDATCRVVVASGRAYEAHMSPLGHASGGVAGGSGVVRARRADEAPRPIPEARLLDTLAAARVGAWYWPVSGVQIWRSEDHDCLYGFARNEGAWTTDRLLALLHPDDVTGVQGAIARALTSANEVV
ncbi:MAG TPA: PAS domain-containing protein, partial [Myxococcota bacterium]|nr:PAS domain-containing protein [Myxococcota bacterium]